MLCGLNGTAMDGWLGWASDRLAEIRIGGEGIMNWVGLNRRAVAMKTKKACIIVLIPLTSMTRSIFIIQDYCTYRKLLR